MYYERKDHGFSFELPDGWREMVGNKPLTFCGPNGYIGCTSEVIQIQIATILPKFVDPCSREKFLAEPGAEISRDKIGDETNVVVLKRQSNGEMSIVRDGMHYCITFDYDATTISAIKRLKETAKFPSCDKADAIIQQHSDPRTQAVNKVLNAGSAGEARRALRDAGISSIRYPGFTMHNIRDSKEKIPQDCVFHGGVVAEIYCKTCDNWMCQECFYEHDC